MVAELKLSGRGTPVTPETFAAWQERKRKKKAEEAQKKVEAELKKKKGGKGLSVLSGRDLYEYKKELFHDDDDDYSDDGNDKAGATRIADSSVEYAAADIANTITDVIAEKATSLFLQGDDDELDDIDDD